MCMRLGAILYHCLTDKPPFQGETPLGTLVQVQMRSPVPPSRVVAGVPDDLERICLTPCLNKSATDRYGSAAHGGRTSSWLPRRAKQIRGVSARNEGVRVSLNGNGRSSHGCQLENAGRGLLDVAGNHDPAPASAETAFLACAGDRCRASPEIGGVGSGAGSSQGKRHAPQRNHFISAGQVGCSEHPRLGAKLRLAAEGTGGGVWQAHAWRHWSDGVFVEIPTLVFSKYGKEVLAL